MSDVIERTETEAPPRRVTPYELLGGEAGVRRLVEAFYRTMDTAPEAAAIRAMHGADLGPITQSVFEWLSGWLGGPALYIERKGTSCLTAPHKPFAIDETARDQWLFCMKRALDEVEFDQRMRPLVDDAFFRLADMVRNR